MRDRQELVQAALVGSCLVAGGAAWLAGPWSPWQWPETVPPGDALMQHAIYRVHGGGRDLFHARNTRPIQLETPPVQGSEMPEGPPVDDYYIPFRPEPYYAPYYEPGNAPYYQYYYDYTESPYPDVPVDLLPPWPWGV